MAYGAEIRNEFGELVTDFSASLTVVESGTTSSSFSLGITIIPDSIWFYAGPQTRELFTFAGSTAFRDAHPHFIGTSSVLPSTTGNAVNQRLPIPLSSFETTTFYQVGSTGLLHHSEHAVDGEFSVNGNQGTVFMCLPTNNTPLPYLKVNPFSPSAFTGDYGFQLKDGFGNTTFDSRSDFLSISEVLFIPQATINNVLFNNAVVNLTLRTPVPNCYISAPNHNSFELPSGGGVRYQHMKIEQTSPTNIRLSRVAHGPPINITQSRGVTNDTVVIVARDPFA